MSAEGVDLLPGESASFEGPLGPILRGEPTKLKLVLPGQVGHVESLRFGGGEGGAAPSDGGVAPTPCPTCAGRAEA